MQPIQHISDTALWVAVYRAEESERPDAVFVDPYARKLAGERGAEIANSIEFAKKNSWSFVARTWLLDECIQQHIADGLDMIINLACGLDTRAYRMNLPSSLAWVEVDFPAMIQYKEEMLAGQKPVCGLQRISLDLSNRPARQDFFKQMNATNKKTLIVSEGLIGYLTEEQAGELASDLSAQPNFRRWVFDMMSPGLLALAKKEMGNFLKGNTELKFAPQNGEAFFIRYGWQPLESKSLLKTAAGLNRLSGELLAYAAIPEPEGPKGDMPWSGVCLFENAKRWVP
jgi:methyltransferase (TIGR00027 family)